MDRHTPGPWSVDEDGEITAARGAVAIAHVNLADDFPCLDEAEHAAAAPDLLATLEDVVAAAQIECEANARLIAASPLLLAVARAANAYRTARNAWLAAGPCVQPTCSGCWQCTTHQAWHREVQTAHEEMLATLAALPPDLLAEP